MQKQMYLIYIYVCVFRYQRAFCSNREATGHSALPAGQEEVWCIAPVLIVCAAACTSKDPGRWSDVADDSQH